MKKKRVASLAIVATIAIFLTISGGKAQAVSCSVPGDYATIQDAVNAPSCDPIVVAPGTYPELAPGPLTINRTLRLLGANDGTDARGARGPESVISDLQGTSVSASGVVIDGFTAENSIAPYPGFGIWLNAGISGTQIVNNIIQNNIAGIALANDGAQALIEHNLIRNNTAPGAAAGSGIYTDQFVGGPRVTNVLIEENAFTGHAGFGGAINISNTDVAHGVFNLTVSTNSFDMNSRAFVLFNTHDSTFDGNTITNSTYVASADIRLFDNNTRLQFTNNHLSRGVGHAIRLSYSATVGIASFGVEFHQNNIEAYGLTGLTVDPLPPGHLGTVNAECNWWNSPSGPFNVPNNPTGTGEEVVGDADFTPWLTAPAPGGPCFGGQPSTAGKVTGGGQIPGDDPVFSPTGDLLSLPALTISSANSNGKATFGFSVRCCPEKGNLEYNDHDADVRIKAQTVDHLTITNGSAACSMVPGAKHAQFTGLASVIRSSQTTTERYVVDVDDCGEPGTNDTFGIHTTPLTYSNGPSQLIGGNIQIH